LFGFSGGGAAALLVLSQGKVAVGAAIALNASTGLTASIEAMERVTKQKYEWTAAARKLASGTDAVRHAADIARGNPPPAVLIVQGLDDTVLTPQPAIALNDALRPYYHGSENGPRLRLSLVSGLPHNWSDGDKDAAELRRTFAAWFADHQ
jgi:pimeloyl-ACP methyl ester carboxylesterase